MTVAESGRLYQRSEGRRAAYPPMRQSPDVKYRAAGSQAEAPWIPALTGESDAPAQLRRRGWPRRPFAGRGAIVRFSERYDHCAERRQCQCTEVALLVTARAKPFTDAGLIGGTGSLPYICCATRGSAASFGDCPTRGRRGSSFAVAPGCFQIAAGVNFVEVRLNGKQVRIAPPSCLPTSPRCSRLSRGVKMMWTASVDVMDGHFVPNSPRTSLVKSIKRSRGPWRYLIYDPDKYASVRQAAPLSLGASGSAAALHRSVDVIKSPGVSVSWLNPSTPRALEEIAAYADFIL